MSPTTPLLRDKVGLKGAQQTPESLFGSCVATFTERNQIRESHKLKSWWYHRDLVVALFTNRKVTVHLMAFDVLPVIALVRSKFRTQFLRFSQ